jgi:integrase/recombinase XerD
MQEKCAMSSAPTITIFVRHSVDCKYKGNEFHRRCNCRKHFRWFANDKQHRRSANTRSWSEAEEGKRELTDQLRGRVVEAAATAERDIRSAADVFIAEKLVEGLTSDLVKKYRLWLDRLTSFCEFRGVYTLRAIDRELLIAFCSNWEALYPSSLTRSKLLERYKSFLRFCVEAGWLATAPKWPKIQVETPPTMPLSLSEYNQLLDAVYAVVRAPENPTVENQTYEYWASRVRALFQLMRWSGLSIQDALTFRRDGLIHRDDKYRVVTQRTKTGTDVSVVIPTSVAKELMAVPNDNQTFFFWSGVGSKKSICSNWGKRFIVPCFEAAGIPRNGHMRSHRLRDTFACELLTAGLAVDDVSRLLGHKSIRTTEKSYAPWVRGRQDRLDVLVMQAWPKTRKKIDRVVNRRVLHPPMEALHM